MIKHVCCKRKSSILVLFIFMIIVFYNTMLEQIIIGLNVNKHKDLYIPGESRKFLHSTIFSQ